MKNIIVNDSAEMFSVPTNERGYTKNLKEHVNYDQNGNITHVQRNGNVDFWNTTLAIDNLEYTYGDNSNQLQSVYDASNSTQGFKDNYGAVAIESVPDYLYDLNGNLTADRNKNITSIKYNHLNLPTEITFNNGTDYKITYIYNAQGEKVKKIVQANTVIRTTDYLDGYQYKQGILQFYPTSEGYVDVTKVNDVYKYNYVYHYKDQLGNIRLSYGLDPRTGITRILEENGYYPYGLKHTNYNSDLKAYGKLNPNSTDVVLKGVIPDSVQEVENVSKYKFNGQEWQDELGLNLYDMDMRDYDPAIARWTGIDPITHHSESTYCFAANNPVFFSDPSGADYALDWAANTAYLNSSLGSSSNWGQSAVGGSPIDYINGFESSAYTTSNTSQIAGILGYTHVYNQREGTMIGTTNGTALGGVQVNSFWSWEKTGEYGNSFNTFAGYASFAGEVTNHNWAKASFKYGQRINGVVHSAEALTNVNRASSILWGTRFAKIGVASGLVGVGVSAYNIRNDIKNGNPVNNWDIADATVGTVATASSIASILVTAGVLASNPVGWAIAIGSTAYFTYRLVSEYNKD